MGLFGFGNSQEKEFKNKMVDVFNLISSYSYGELSSSAKPKIETSCQELKMLYNRFSNPFEAHFNVYYSFNSAVGDTVSIAEGFYAALYAKELAYQGVKISKSVHQKILLEAKALCSSYSGRQEIQNIINRS